VSPFGKLFWGLLIVFVDLRINGFDLLIDLLGYVVVVIGLGELARRNRNFDRARPYATVLLILSALDLFTRTPTGDSSVSAGLFGSPGWAIAFAIALAFVNLMLVYLVCRGIGEMATQAGATDLADLSHTRWFFFIATYVGSTLLLIGAFAASDTLVSLAIVSIIASLVAAFLVLGLIRRADKTFYPRGA
jgi:hypothetical protein